LCSRRLARRLHHQVGFDAILSFDLAVTGGLAWRLGRDLGIPACGWATGSDIRARPLSSTARSVTEALRNLDLVFYQSAELKALGARLRAVRVEDLSPRQHIVQSRGVTEPKALPGEEVRRSIRSMLHVSDDQVLVLYLGRIVRGKGLFELVEGFADWAKGRPDMVLVVVGSFPGFDHTPELEATVKSLEVLNGRIRILPACEHDRIWDFFKAADIFAFPSFKEGMPNSLLEAMLAGLPAVAFSIPAVQEITRLGEGLLEVPAYDFPRFGQTLLRLADDPSLRCELGKTGQSLAREHFSASRTMRSVVNHIQRIAAGRCESVT
jgi:glycosyltransferase involved in cell wall biosynthesis